MHAWVDGRLEGERLRHFEARLDCDDALRAEAQAWRRQAQALKGLGRDTLGEPVPQPLVDAALGATQATPPARGAHGSAGRTPPRRRTRLRAERQGRNPETPERDPGCAERADRPAGLNPDRALLSHRKNIRPPSPPGHSPRPVCNAFGFRHASRPPASGPRSVFHPRDIPERASSRPWHVSTGRCYRRRDRSRYGPCTPDTR